MICTNCGGVQTIRGPIRGYRINSYSFCGACARRPPDSKEDPRYAVNNKTLNRKR